MPGWRRSGQAEDHLTGVRGGTLAARDNFYLGHDRFGRDGIPLCPTSRGPKGFKVIDDRTLAFADHRGNKQYVSTGNLQSDDRVALIFVDYPRARHGSRYLGHVEISRGQRRRTGYHACLYPVTRPLSSG